MASLLAGRSPDHANSSRPKTFRDSLDCDGALRRPLPDAKLEALRTFARAMVAKRGWVDQVDIQAFVDAGYGQRQVLEAILGVGLKVMSNDTNHVADTPASGRSVARCRARARVPPRPCGGRQGQTRPVCPKRGAASPRIGLGSSGGRAETFVG
jgi:hypothetical protein